MTVEIMLRAERLGYSYGPKPALVDVSFELAAGTCTILLGPNGAGKSTLFNLVTRLYDSRDGRIDIAGYDVKRQSYDALARLGVVFQQPTLDLELTVEQNLRYHGALHGLSRRQCAERIETELARFQLTERRREKVRSLNGGHRRRVEIARALLHEPKVLLLDEPTVGLDVPSRNAIVDHVHELCRTCGMTVLWASHLIDEIRPTDHLIVLDRGRIQARGPVASVLEQAGAADIAGAFKSLTSRAA